MVVSIRRVALPRWFGLSWDAANPERPAVSVKLTEPCMWEVKPILAGYAYAEAEKKFRSFEHWEPDVGQGFGFDDAFKPAVEQDGLIVLRLELANIASWHAQVASLRLLFGALSTYEEVRKGGKGTQLMVLSVGLTADRDRTAAFCGGETSAVFAGWLQSQSSEALAPAKRAMEEAEYALFFTSSKDKFRAAVPVGGVPLLTVDGGGGRWLAAAASPGLGYELYGHNLDTAANVLVVLAGLAALHDLAVEDLG